MYYLNEEGERRSVNPKRRPFFQKRRRAFRGAQEREAQKAAPPTGQPPGGNPPQEVQRKSPDPNIILDRTRSGGKDVPKTITQVKKQVEAREKYGIPATTFRPDPRTVEQPTFWETYKWPIIGGAALLLIGGGVLALKK